MHGSLIQSQMSGDIETNPGPVINSTKTIQAPYTVKTMWQCLG